MWIGVAVHLPRVTPVLAVPAVSGGWQPREGRDRSRGNHPDAADWWALLERRLLAPAERVLMESGKSGTSPIRMVREPHISMMI
jgi:hypothetical protein